MWDSWALVNLGFFVFLVKDYPGGGVGSIIDCEVYSAHKMIQRYIPITHITERVVPFWDDIITQITPVFPMHHMSLYTDCLDGHTDISTVDAQTVKLFECIRGVPTPDGLLTRIESI